MGSLRVRKWSKSKSNSWLMGLGGWSEKSFSQPRTGKQQLTLGQAQNCTEDKHNFEKSKTCNQNIK